MDLSNSKYLKETPNFEGMQNVERLDLMGCTNLLSVHPSISCLRLLAFLSLQNCCSLVSLDLFRYEEPTLDNTARRLSPLRKLENLRVLRLSGCTKLEKTPDFRGFPNVEYLDFKQCISLSTVDSSIGFHGKLKYLSFGGCTNLVRLPPNINDLTSLQTLDLEGCLKLMDLPLAYEVRPFSNLESLIVLDLGFCNLTSIPDAIGCLRCLERLNLEGNKFTALPSGMRKLLSLAYLNLAHCHELVFVPILPSKHASSGGRYFKTQSGSRNQRSGLYTFDCRTFLKLGVDWRPFALEWLFKLVQAPRCFRCGFDIVVPGRIVFSEWFSHQFEGDSIIRIVDFDAVTDNWIGFAFFASFQAKPRPSISNDSYPFCLSFETEQAEETFSMPLRLDLATTYGSNHLWLIYISRPHCHFVRSGAHISFKAHPHLKIRNWGLRVVFEQDTTVILWQEPEIPFNYVRENRGSSVPKVQLPYNWLVTDEEERENIEAESKENNLSNMGLTTSHVHSIRT